MQWLLILAVLGGAAFFGVTYFQNKFNALKSKANEAKRKVLGALDVRIELIKRLDSQLERGESIGKNAVSSALRLAEKAANTQRIDELALLIDDKNKHLERASMQLRNPNLTENANRLNPILDELSDNSRKLQLARREYNDHAKEYNQMAGSGVGSFVAQIMKFEQLPIMGSLQD